MTNVLFVQGGGQNVHAEWDRPLVESLRGALGAPYDVRYPRMPNEADPSLATWRPALEQELAALGDGGIAVGHSVGGTILINVLVQSKLTIRLHAIVLIAAPFVGEGGWPSDDSDARADLARGLPSDVPLYLYHGDDDAMVPVSHVELYARALPWAQVRRLKGRDHQLNNDLSEIARDLRELECMRDNNKREP